MKKLNSIIKKYGYWIVIAIVFINSLYILTRVPLSLDDLTYKQVAACDISEIIHFFKWHYLNYNGRTLVHILLVLVLKNTVTLWIWRVFCAASICFLFYIASELASSERSQFKQGACFSAVIFLLTSPGAWVDSVYWVSGYFNYMLPAIFVMLTILVGKKKHKSICFTIMCIICSMTTEIAGMMIIGALALYVLDYFIQNRKIETAYFGNLKLSIMGYLTVILSPGVSLRVSTQSKVEISDFFENYIAILQAQWFGKFAVIIHSVLLLLLSMIVVFKNRKTIRAIEKIYKPYFLSVSVLLVFNYAVLLNSKFGFIELDKKFNVFIFAVWIIYVIMYFALIAFAGIIVYYNEKNIIPIMLLILAWGSQFMMAVSQGIIMRTVTYALIPLNVYETWAFLYIYNYYMPILKEKKLRTSEFINFGLKCSVLIAIIFQLVMIFVIFRSYTNDTVPMFKKLNEAEMVEFEKKLEVDFEEYYSSDLWSKDNNILDFSYYRS